MDIQFIDITSFAGISSDAEHFYALIGNPKFCQEDYITMTDYCSPESGVIFSCDCEHLLFFPTVKQAEYLSKKDNHNVIDEDVVNDYVKNGTKRFPSIVEVVRAARKRFYNSLLVFSINGSRKEFAKLLNKHKDDGMLFNVCETLGLFCNE